MRLPSRFRHAARFLAAAFLLSAVAAAPRDDFQSAAARVARARYDAALTKMADDYAAAFGARVADLLEISDADGGFDRPMARGMAFAAPAQGGGPEASFDFEPQPQTVSGQVTLRFTMTSPTLEG
jgi:uncharacterized protein YggE